MVSATQLESRSPRYMRVRDQLAADVADGDLVPGALLPSESSLASRYGASRLTVRKALSLLKEEGVVTSRQGVGWSVSQIGPMRQPLDSLVSIDEQIMRAGRTPGRRLLTFTVGPPPSHVRQILRAGSALQIARLNLADGTPVGRNTAWVPEDLASDLSLKGVEARSLLHLLPITLGSATQVITAESATADDSALLDVDGGAPLLRFERTTHDVAGRPVLYSEAVYNPQRTEFTVELAAFPTRS